MGDGRDRNQHGQYADAIPPEDVLEVFDEREDRARPVTAKDVTESLGIARRTAHNKLNQLVERGELDTRKVGARGRVWWVPIREDVEGAVQEEGDPATEDVLTREEFTELLAEATDTTPAAIEEGAADLEITPPEDAEVVGYEGRDPTTEPDE